MYLFCFFDHTRAQSFYISSFLIHFMSLDTYAQLYSQSPHLADCLVGVGGRILLFESYLDTSATPKQLYKLGVHLDKAIGQLGNQLNALRFPGTSENGTIPTITHALREGKNYYTALASWFADFQPALIDYAKYGSDSSKELVEEKLGELQQQHVLGGLGFVIKVLFDSRVHFSSPEEWAAYTAQDTNPSIPPGVVVH